VWFEELFVVAFEVLCVVGYGRASAGGHVRFGTQSSPWSDTSYLSLTCLPRRSPLSFSMTTAPPSRTVSPKAEMRTATIGAISIRTTRTTSHCHAALKSRIDGLYLSTLSAFLPHSHCTEITDVCIQITDEVVEKVCPRFECKKHTNGRSRARRPGA
jgi:hypothetical protein